MKERILAPYFCCPTVGDSQVRRMSIMRGLGSLIKASFRSLLGGEIREFTELLEDSRKQAMDRMVKNAQAMGANAIIMMRYDSGELGQSMSEIVAYGTAAVLEKVN